MLFIKKMLNNNMGSAGLLALIGMLFFGIIGGAYITLSNSGIKTSTALRDGIAAQYLAEAGAQWALAQLKSNPNYENEAEPVTATRNQETMTTGSYRVTVKGKTVMTKTIISIGTVNNVTRKVVLRANGSVFDKAIYAKGEMSINGGANSGINKITGSIASDGTIIISGGTADTLSKGSTVYCNTLEDYSGKIKNENNVQLPTGGILNVDDLMNNKPDFIKKGVDLQALISDGKVKKYTLGTYNYFDGNYIMNDNDPIYTAPKGQETIIYVNGDFQMRNNIFGDDITIYVNGDLTLTDGATIKPNDSNSRVNIYVTKNIHWNSTHYQGKGLIVAKGNINFNSGAGGEQTLLISGGDIQVNENSKVGALYANGTIQIANGATANYDKVKNFITELRLTAPTVNSWSDRES